MIELTGIHNTAKVFTDNLEETARLQILGLLNQDFSAGAKIRIMPDTHAGAGCVIGFTANLGNKVIPNLVGVDIGCGMHVTRLGKINPDLHELDSVIRENVPCGREVHAEKKVDLASINQIICLRDLNGDYKKFIRGVGTLGGGNHFIELNKDDEGEYYLVIHSGSRNLGKQVADYYQKLAINSCKGLGDYNSRRMDCIKFLKEAGEEKKIQSSLKKLEKEFANTATHYPEELCYLEGQSRENYLHDMNICQEYAAVSRDVMAKIIVWKMFGKTIEAGQSFQTIHNYVDFGDNVIRKGAVSARNGEQLIIPINMRDGSILATGKGNEDWNNSAPHGAGRLMGRNEAKRRLSMGDFTASMEGVYSTTVNESTLDEAPMAYKPMQEILDNIVDTVTVDKIIKPVYNFKASE